MTVAASRLLRWALLTALALAPAVAGAAEPPQWLLGQWVLNNELTKTAQPEGKETRDGFDSFGRPTITIGGIPLPGTGGGMSGPVSSAPTRDPSILRCSEFSVEAVGNELLVTYVGIGSEKVKAGNDQGRKTKWNRSKLTSSYETTTRKVTQTYQLGKDGRVTVTVSLNPNQGSTVIDKRVFERPAPEAAPAG